MICKRCPASKRMLRNGHGCVMCLIYGIIVRDNHECTRDGWKHFKRDDCDGDGIGEETGFPEDGSDAFKEMPGILSESGE